MELIWRELVLTLQAEQVHIVFPVNKPTADPANWSMMDIDFSQALVTNYFFFRLKEQTATELTKRRENCQLNR
jgi:hypothetical protein